MRTNLDVFDRMMAVVMVFMFLTPLSVPGVVGAVLMHTLTIAVVVCIMGMMALIYFILGPSHGELVRRKSEPYHEGLRIRPKTLSLRFFSVTLLRATRSPRATHR